jgi:hypothetical protein
LVTACVQFLQLHGIYAWRQGNQGVYDPARQRFRSFRGLRGVSDVLGCLAGGRLLAVETKSPGGRLSPEQREFLRRVGELGGLALVVRSVKELEMALRTEGVIE